MGDDPDSGGTSTGFCSDPLWDEDLTWNTANPNFSRCMRDTVLTAVPLGVLVITHLLRLFVDRVSRTKDTCHTGKQKPRLSQLFRFKVIFMLILLGNAAYELYSRSKTEGLDRDPWSNSETFGSCCLLLSYLLALLLMLWDKCRCRHTSPSLFLFWLTLTFCSLPTFKAQLESQFLCMDGVSAGELAILTVTFFPVVSLLLLLNCLSDIDNSMDPKAPLEDSASFLSTLTFSWFDKLIYTGFRTPLTQSQLPEAPVFISVQNNVDDFLTNWKAQVRTLGVDFAVDRNKDKLENKPKLPTAKVSIIPVLFKTFGIGFCGVIPLCIAFNTMTFAGPMLLDLLIKHVSTASDEEWKGYLYSFLLFACALVGSVMSHLNSHQITVMSLQMQSACISMIYRKSLCLSSKARSNFTSGEITNLMSVDAQMIVETFPFLNNLWAFPYTIILALCFLHRQIGLAALAGFLAFSVIIPVNIWGMRRRMHLQKDQLKWKDARLKLINEALAGIKVLKLSAWEKPFIKRIVEMRKKEIHNLRMFARVKTLINSSFAISPVIVTLTSFGTYLLISTDHIMTANKIFVCLSLFNIMRMPLVLFPWSLIETVKLFVSLKRIDDFLNAEELASDTFNNQELSNCLEMTNASFTWGLEKEPTLKDITLTVPSGSLVAIVGRVGSGKSTLISAMLGEIENVAGRTQMHNDVAVAYVPQQAWIQNMSLKNNILFDTPYSDHKFKEVVKACALDSDLDILPQGEETEIGENGINLSGGQKQRVSLARAVYWDADLYLLDDPLSAVDMHVGKHIFEEVIGSVRGMLKEKTRVLVSHSTRFLDKMDQIVVMKDGSVAEMGSYKELLESKGAFADFLLNYKDASNNESEENGDAEETKQRQRTFLKRMSRKLSLSEFPLASDDVLEERKKSLTRQVTRKSSLVEFPILAHANGAGDERMFLRGHRSRKTSLVEADKKRFSLTMQMPRKTSLAEFPTLMPSEGAEKRKNSLNRQMPRKTSLAEFPTPMSSEGAGKRKNSLNRQMPRKTSLAEFPTMSFPKAADDKRNLLKSMSRRSSMIEFPTTGKDTGLFLRQVSRKSSLVEAPAMTVIQKRRRSSATGVPVKKHQRRGDLIEEEKARMGKVKWSVYFNYIRSVGYWRFGFCTLLYAVGQIFHTAGDFSLSMWADRNDEYPEGSDMSTKNFMIIYGCLGTAYVLNEFIRELFHFYNAAKASEKMHTAMLDCVMRGPMSFFDTTPKGRIVNRFSADINTLDVTISRQITDLLWCISDVIGIITIISIGLPIFTAAIVPIFITYIILLKYYIPCTRQLKRLESIAKSPIFAHFCETIQGASSIRAYKEKPRFILESEEKVANNLKVFYLCAASARWLGVRTDFLAGLIILFTSLFAVMSREWLSSGIASLVICYSLNVTAPLNWLVKQVCEMEISAVAMERIMEYTNNTLEANWDIPIEDDKVGAEWPQEGKISFEDYQTKYREDLDLVLNCVSMEVGALEKVGICGRTGAGKSSLMLSLFRTIEATGGRIIIDGTDISKLGLHRLRSRLTIIPQDPVLFTGNLRFNLDPTGQHTDEELWRALENAHLKSYVAGLQGGLEHEVQEGGENFSVGQRQLICMARALIRKTKILVLDEATAAVDLETDGLIQVTIRKQFADCTVLTIAHRLDTVMDSDRIAVISGGRLVEMDTPEALLHRNGSVFRDMARSANLQASMETIDCVGQ